MRVARTVHSGKRLVRIEEIRVKGDGGGKEESVEGECVH